MRRVNHKFAGGGAHSIASAFTLAEVLITLGVVGVVAALTIPSVISNGNERKNITKLKKVYSQLSTVYNQAAYEKGYIKDYLAQYPGMYDEESHKAFRDYFASYFNVTHKGKYSAHWDDYVASDNNSFSTFVGIDGTAYIFRLLPNNCESTFGVYADNIPVCGEIFVDLYSGKGETWESQVNKRTVGKNVFLFHVTKDKLIPAGIQSPNSETLDCYTNKYACTQWVLLNENMDYFHCKGLNWNGKLKCK